MSMTKRSWVVNFVHCLISSIIAYYRSIEIILYMGENNFTLSWLPVMLITAPSRCLSQGTLSLIIVMFKKQNVFLSSAMQISWAALELAYLCVKISVFNNSISYWLVFASPPVYPRCYTGVHGLYKKPFETNFKGFFISGMRINFYTILIVVKRPSQGWLNIMKYSLIDVLWWSLKTEVVEVAVKWKYLEQVDGPFKECSCNAPILRLSNKTNSFEDNSNN